jgi:predicted amidohydrolase/predicted N-acetyltransferase YhbS
MTQDSSIEKRKLIIRQAQLKDVPAMEKLSLREYGPRKACSDDELRGQMTQFPKGQLLAEYEGKIVGFCATFRISRKLAFAPHTWDEITGNGFASRHDSRGQWLYGMDVCVDQEYRGLRIGNRLYNARKKLCQELELKGIIFGGRMPLYAKRRKKIGSPEEYLKQVQEKRLRDPVLNFQLRNGFEPIGVLKDYWKEDKESAGYAAHMVWYNPKLQNLSRVEQHSHAGRLPDSVRVLTIQFQARKLESVKEFEQQVEYFVDVAADYKADFALFPENFTLPLISIENRHPPPAEAVRAIASYEERFCEFMSHLAVRYNINIIGGTHPALDAEDHIRNTCFVFLRDGAVHKQEKMHITPNEQEWLHMQGGDELQPIMTDCGPIGVLICYDVEFPELARHLVDQGAQLLFVPFCTDERQGYMRVRYCAQARAIENQCYVATSGVVGNLPGVENMDIHYAVSGIFTPCDFPFARDGIAAETAANTEMVALADIRMDSLHLARNNGTVMNLRDRRFDLYNVRWKK